MFEKLKKEVDDVKRLDKIFKVLAKNEINLLKKGKKISPKALKDVLEELGGSFIKLGQLLSLRPDLIPLDYCEELTKLQDDVKPISYKKFEEIFKKNFPNKKIVIDEKPLGSASIAQVHKAKYKKKNIVIKLRKPGVKQQFETDLDILKKIAKIVTKNHKFKHLDPIQIINEFETYTRNELNFFNEARNIVKVKEKTHQKEVIIPKHFEELSNEEVLSLEYVKGKKLSKIKNPADWIFETLAKEFWDQIFEHGIFHADPHPGNILLEKYQIGLIDWGIVGELTEEMKLSLRNLFFGIILKDTEAVVYSIQKLNVARVPINTYDLKRDIQKDLDKYYGKKLQELRAGEIFERLLELMRNYDFYVDKNYILLMKSVLTVESVGLSYKKDFNLFDVALPYVKKKTKRNINEIAKQEIIEIKEAIKYLKRLPEQASVFFDEGMRQEKILEEVKEDIDSLDNQVKLIGHELVLVVGAAALVISSILLLPYTHNGIPFVSAVGFLLTAAMVLNIIHIVRK